jgi:hypothetical protein
MFASWWPTLARCWKMLVHRRLSNALFGRQLCNQTVQLAAALDKSFDNPVFKVAGLAYRGLHGESWEIPRKPGNPF